MIFVDPDGYWEKDATYDANGNIVTRAVNLDGTIPAIFKMALNRPATRDKWVAKVKFTTDPGAIRALLDAHAPQAQQRLKMMLAGALTSLSAAQWRH
jgi:hypothetical protein